jgi:hypothetical protein
MNFNGTEGSFIEMEEGVSMTTAYREAQPEDNMCIFFGKEMLNELLKQEHAMGLRFYFARNDEGKTTLVTVAVNEKGQDIQAKVGNKGHSCPTDCCTDSPLAGV